MKYGIDVSYAQGQLDWERLIDQNRDKIDFVMVRIGYGKRTIDAQAVRNLTALNKLGIPCGAYWFSYALTRTMAWQEALQCVNFIRDYKIEYPIVYDFEYASRNYARHKGIYLSGQDISGFVEEFCNCIEYNKYYAMFYTNKDYKLNIYNKSLFERYDNWYAYYTSSPNIPSGTHLQQYSSKGNLNCYDKYVDLNRTDRDYPDIIKKAKLNHL